MKISISYNAQNYIQSYLHITNDNWFTEEEEFQREIFQAKREQIYREAEKKWGLSWAS